jgi:hypothetical protein
MEGFGGIVGVSAGGAGQKKSALEPPKPPTIGVKKIGSTKPASINTNAAGTPQGS